jgi:hypothetical protein
MVAALRRFQPPVSTAHNARMELRFGGCSRQGLLMKRPPNFIDAQSATTPGATTPSRPQSTPQYLLPFSTILLFSLQLDQAYSCRASRSGGVVVVNNLLIIWLRENSQKIVKSIVTHIFKRWAQTCCIQDGHSKRSVQQRAMFKIRIALPNR